MYEIHRDKWIWAFTLQLIKEESYQWLEQPEMKHAVPFVDRENRKLPSIWLYKNTGRRFFLIRLQAIDIAWGSMISRDKRMFSDMLPSIRKKLKASTLSVLNIYVYPNAQEEQFFWDDISGIEQLDRKTSILTENIFMAPLFSNYEEGIQKLQLPSFGIEEDRLSHTLYIMQDMELEQIKQEVWKEHKLAFESFQKTFQYGRPILTYLFLGINLLLYLLLEAKGSSTDIDTLILFGAKFIPNIIAGDYWRFITPMFLHIGWVHLFFNCLALFFLGRIVEGIYGSFRFFWIYLIAGIVGTVASFAFTPQLSAGASGAIFGLFGALLFFGWKNKNLFFRTLGSDVIVILFINLSIGFIFPMIDNFGHIGGLIGGFLISIILGLPFTYNWRLRIITATFLLIMLGLFLYIGFTRWVQLLM